MAGKQRRKPLGSDSRGFTTGQTAAWIPRVRQTAPGEWLPRSPWQPPSGWE